MEEKQVRIAVVGTHGVGKTGLVHSLASAFIARGYSTDAILEVARELARLKPDVVKLNENSTLESQAEILKYQFKREDEARKYNVMVTDRAFDNYLYMERRFGSQKKYKNLILRRLHENPYDLVVRVPLINDTIQDDGVRSTDITFQRDIDRRVLEFLLEYKIDHITLQQPVMPYREDWVYAVLRPLAKIRPDLKNLGI